MERFSLIDLFPDIDPVKIVDIGALFIGVEESPYGDLVRDGKAEIIGFEPDREGCDKLNRIHGAPHKFLPYFVGDGCEKTFYETNHSMTGSLFKPNDPLLQKFQNLYELTTLKDTHAVQTKKLDDIKEITDVDFIKIDVQGSELMVFQGGPKRLAQTTLIQTEICFVELYESQPTFGDLDQHLRKNGFQFHTFTGFGQRCFKPMLANNDPNQGLRQYLWSDAVYVRDFLKLDELPITKLMRMALLLHDLFQSYDLCLLILSEADRKQPSNRAQLYLQTVSA